MPVSAGLRMALEPKQQICVKCGDFEVVESTGAYNNPDNLTGYGTPNADFGDAVPYTIAFTPPKTDTVAFTIDLNDAPPEPDEDGHYTYVVTKEDLGFGAKDDIPSGVWKVRVVFGAQTKDLSLFATGEIERKIAKCICCSGTQHVMLDYVLKGAKYLFQCHKLTEAQAIIDQLYRDTATCCGCQ